MGEGKPHPSLSTRPHLLFLYICRRNVKSRREMKDFPERTGFCHLLLDRFFLLLSLTQAFLTSHNERVSCPRDALLGWEFGSNCKRSRSFQLLLLLWPN